MIRSGDLSPAAVRGTLHHLSTGCKTLFGAPPAGILAVARQLASTMSMFQAEGRGTGHAGNGFGGQA